MRILNPIAIITLLSLSCLYTQAQVSEASELYQVLKEKDSLLFHAAFNACDTWTMSVLFTEDFEFYHDKAGATISRKEFLDPMQKECESRAPNHPQPAKRILIPESLEVYPLYKNGDLYGAIQQGVHRFEFLNDEGNYQKGDIARFTHLWIKTENEWKIKRELSYDHQPSVTK